MTSVGTRLFEGSVWVSYTTYNDREALWRVVGALYHLGASTLLALVAHTKLSPTTVGGALRTARRRTQKGGPVRLVRQIKGAPVTYAFTKYGLKLARQEWSAPTQLTDLQYRVLRWTTASLLHHPFVTELGIKLPRLRDICTVYRRMLAAGFITAKRGKIELTYSGKVKMMVKQAAEERKKKRDAERQTRSTGQKKQRRRRR